MNDYRLLGITVICSFLVGCATSTIENCDPTNRNFFTIQHCSSDSAKNGYQRQIEDRKQTVYALKSDHKRALTENERLRYEMSKISAEVGHLKNSVSLLETEILTLQDKYEIAKQNPNYGQQYKREILSYLYSIKGELEKARDVEIPEGSNPKDFGEKKRQIARAVDEVATTISEVKTAPFQAAWLIISNMFKINKRIKVFVDILDAFKVLVDGYVEIRPYFNN